MALLLFLLGHSSGSRLKDDYSAPKITSSSAPEIKITLIIQIFGTWPKPKTKTKAFPFAYLFTVYFSFYFLFMFIRDQGLNTMRHRGLIISCSMLQNSQYRKIANAANTKIFTKKIYMSNCKFIVNNTNTTNTTNIPQMPKITSLIIVLLFYS